MKVTMTNKADTSISETYPVVTNVKVMGTAEHNYRPHFVLILPGFDTATFSCAEWQIDIQ